MYLRRTFDVPRTARCRGYRERGWVLTGSVPCPENKIPDDGKSPSAGLSPLDGAEPQVRFEHHDQGDQPGGGSSADGTPASGSHAA